MDKKLLRYYSSSINQKLKIYLKKDKKILNTKNANYSYDGLQKVLNKGLKRIPINKINSVLILGMGAGSVVESLRNIFFYYGPILGVELDPVVIEIAEKEFNISQFHDVEIVKADGKKFLKNHTKQYDLIIIDIFIDIKVPKRFYSQKFWKKVENRVQLNGFVLFNAGIDLTEKEIDKFLNSLPISFVYMVKTEVLKSNTLIILQKIIE
ncbi:MAG TPA: fused MFS/spermidine synthase [Chitinophagaceae bacterium]|nr:fused MFS/spermidine synthase [Chitinophagaceae bacterium]